MITVKQSGSFDKLVEFINKCTNFKKSDIFDVYGQMGVDALKEATPKRTGKTANSWTYKVTRTSNSVRINWVNTNEAGGKNIALMLNFGHATKRGGYVQGRNYIQPAVEPVFNKIEKELKKEVENY